MTVVHSCVRFQVNQKQIIDLDARKLPKVWNARPKTPVTQVIDNQ